MTPRIAPSRAITLASFGGCLTLLVALFAVLLGCASFSAAPDPVTPNVKNAILCSCDCEGTADVFVPAANPIGAGPDDASQAVGKGIDLTSKPLVLGQGNTVGLRFHLGVPPKATINSAFIQFVAASDKDDQTTDLDIKLVNAADVAQFTSATDLTGFSFVGPIHWTPDPWNKAGDRLDAEKTIDLGPLVQVIVNLDNYTPQSAIAFLITGLGRRAAFAFESQADKKNPGPPAALKVSYTPRTIKQDFLTCGDASTADSRNNVCQNLVQSNVSSLANQCKVAKSCTCAVAPVPDSDKTSFSQVCNNPCPKVVAPDNCDPNLIAQTTAATDSHTPVCVATSPLGSVLFGQRSACDIDPSQSNVHARAFKGDDSSSSDAAPRGRIEFVGRPCPGDNCTVGMTHRMNVGDMTFPSHSILASDVVVNDLTGVGESTINAFLFNGDGSFSKNLTTHSVRGHQVDGDTVAVANQNTDALGISIGVDPSKPVEERSWNPGALCTMRGTLFSAGNQDDGGFEMSVDIRGTLVNQPPTADACPSESRTSADACPDRTEECNITGGATFTLKGAATDPDNNVASIGWFSGDRKGPLVGTVLTAELTQDVKTTTSYVLKVIDLFGQYDEDTVKVSVVDTTPPEVTAPNDVTAECNPADGVPGHGTAVVIGTATATDVCDLSPSIPTSNAPQTFPLGATKVKWSATDDSGNEGTAIQTVTIVDTTPPDLTVTLSPDVLWSPNHKLVTITANITVTDKCDPNPFVKLISVKSNEPDNGLGDGDQPDDIQGATGGPLVLGADTRSFQVRAERAGNGTGRVYTFVYEASDHNSGKTTQRTATVTVPRTQSK